MLPFALAASKGLQRLKYSPTTCYRGMYGPVQGTRRADPAGSVFPHRPSSTSRSFSLLDEDPFPHSQAMLEPPKAEDHDSMTLPHASAQPEESSSPSALSTSVAPGGSLTATDEARHETKLDQPLDWSQDGGQDSGTGDSPVRPITEGPDADRFDNNNAAEVEETWRYLSSLLEEATANMNSSRVLDRERKAGKLGIRSLQSLLHGSFTYIRIEQLERELKELQKKVEGKGEDWQYVEEKAKFPVFLPQLRRTTPGEFTQTYDSVRLPPSQQAAIEISVAQGSSHVQEASGSGGPDAFEPSFRRTPERVLIRSHALLEHLDDVLDFNLMNSAGEMNIGIEGSRVFYSVIFLRPFKLFVLYDEKIRKSVQDLEKEMTSKSDPSAPGDPAAAVALGRREAPEDKRYKDEDLQKDLNLLINVLDFDLKLMFELRTKVQNGIDAEVEYEDLWHVFQRGDIVISRHSPEHAFRLLNIAGGRDPLSHGPFLHQERLNTAVTVDGFALDCYSLSSDGVSYVPILEHFSIRRFFGTQRITELPFFPLKFHPDATRLTAEMTERGQLFVSITRQPFQHMLAKGKTRDEPRQGVDAQVIVDMVLALNARPDWRPPSNMSQNDLTEQDPRETYEKSYCAHSGGANCCGSHSIHADYFLDEEDSSRYLMSMGGGLFRSLAADEVTEEHYMLMRPFVHAFVLRSREWVTLSVSDLGPVVFESSFKDLRIPDDHKTVVQALVKTHEAGKKDDGGLRAQSIGAAMDIVKGKGRGLIILLHGAPGVGKTSTAECVADDTRRPLYPITCGDIGETALEVERNLHNSFQLAQKWGCVLLLDEADVFLSKRTRSDLRHNAVTSVFLRSLEYYSGILFLTTNRVGVMDLAFKSRIQMTLFYPKLDLEVTLRLYEMFTERAKKEQDQRASHRFRIKEREILRFAKKHYKQLERDGLDTWNGRQIRNAFQTAIALAEYEATEAGPDDPKPVLGKKQFESVAMGARKFDEYLTSTTGKSESDAARTDAWRDDRFAGGAAPAPPARSMTAQYPAPRGLQKRATVLDDDTDSESDSEGSGSEDDSEAEEEEQEERRTRARRAKKAAAASKSPRRKAKDKEDDSASAAEYRQFLEWQKMRQSQGKT